MSRYQVQQADVHVDSEDEVKDDADWMLHWTAPTPKITFTLIVKMR